MYLEKRPSFKLDISLPSHIMHIPAHQPVMVIAYPLKLR